MCILYTSKSHTSRVSICVYFAQDESAMCRNISRITIKHFAYYICIALISTIKFTVCANLYNGSLANSIDDAQGLCECSVCVCSAVKKITQGSWTFASHLNRRRRWKWRQSLVANRVVGSNAQQRWWFSIRTPESEFECQIRYVTPPLSPYPPPTPPPQLIKLLSDICSIFYCKQGLCFVLAWNRCVRLVT